jgi:hypothetical protein
MVTRPCQLGAMAVGRTDRQRRRDGSGAGATLVPEPFADVQGREWNRTRRGKQNVSVGVLEIDIGMRGAVRFLAHNDMG